MKRIGKIMEEMGFNKHGSDSVKEAFVRHLIKASTGVNIEPKHGGGIQLKQPQHKAENPKQLSFNFEPNFADPSQTEAQKKKEVG
jgi:hypothetical protein